MDEPRLAPPAGLEYVGISALPERGMAGIGSLLGDPLADATATLESHRRQQIGGAPDNLVDAYGAYMEMMRRIFGPSIVERTIGARDALRRGDAKAAHDLTMPSAMDFASFVGSIKPIRAYHGSPHDFDKFDLSKIGTGEGAQAYGHGLYFAENEGVARSYRDALSTGRRGADAPVFSSVGELKFVRPDTAHDIAEQGMPALQKRLAALDDDIAFVRRYPGDNGNEAIRHMMQEKDELARLAATGDFSTKKGRMYEVNIHADPKQFLDWDKPLSGQSEAVRGIAENVKESSSILRRKLDSPDAVGQDVWESLRSPFPAKSLGYRDWSTKGPAEYLNDRGIPGVRYLDQGSRASGDGSRNYVVFDDNLIEILRKYGLGGLVVGGAAGIGSLPVPEDGL